MPGSSSASAAAGAHAAYLGQRYFSSLDGLRTLAIVPVVWHHATPRPLDGLLGRGPLGVDLFFVLSGFLITHRLLAEERETGTIGLRAFYKRRALRIFPLYYAVLFFFTLYALALPPELPSRAHFLRSLPFFATYTANWFVDWTVPHPILFAFSWSLAVEEQFYLFWPSIVLAGRRHGARWVFMSAVFLLDQALRRGMRLPSLVSTTLVERVLHGIASPICLGALLGLSLASPAGHRCLRWALGHRPAAPVALALLGGCIADGRPSLLVLHLAMAAVVAACALRPDHGLAPLLGGRLFRPIGVVSYGIYLLHVPVLGALKYSLSARHPPAWLLFLIALPLTFAFACASHRWFESPLRALGQRAQRPSPSCRSLTPARLPRT